MDQGLPPIHHKVARKSAQKLGDCDQDVTVAGARLNSSLARLHSRDRRTARALIADSVDDSVTRAIVLCAL